MKWKLETEVEIEMQMQLVDCCSPSKIHILLAFVPRHPMQSSPHLQFLITCFAIA